MARLAIIGTGYVGLTTGACLAHLGHDVVCADVDVEKVDRLADGEVPIVEAGLSDLVAEGLSADRLRFTADVAGSVADRQVVFLCVPTPHAPDGSVDLSYVEAAAASIGASLAPGAVVVNKSTVPVGTTAVVSGIIGRDDVAVASNPEFLREGTAVADFLGPDRIVIGSDDDRAREVVRSIYDGVDAPMVLTDPASAETIKYAANAFLATKLSFANAIAAVCEGVGADVSDVMSGLGYDRRIGPEFLNPGPGWGGSCLPKDTRALIRIAEDAGYDFRFLEGVIEVNEEQFARVAAKVRRAAGGQLERRTVAVWGLTFKAGTDDLRDSPALEVVDRLLVSPRFGERWARQWLDLARYADTSGYAADRTRNMWVYRDWVIHAINNNKRFDQFTIEQIAGDLLPNGGPAEKVATGFHRNAMQAKGNNPRKEEFRVKTVVDRLKTTGRTWLGLTLECAECHDHTHDPVSQKEYYQLYAFFNSVDGEIGAGGRSGYHNKPLPPLLKVRTGTHQQKRTDLQARLETRTAELKAARERPEFTDPGGDLAPALKEWVTSLALPKTGLLPVSNGLQLHLDAGSFDAPGGFVKEWPDLSGNDRAAVATGQPKQFGRALNGRPAIRLDGKNDFLRTASGAGQLGADFTMVLVLQFNDLARHQMALMWGDESQGKRRAFWKTDKNKFSFNGYGADMVGSADLKRSVPVIAIITQQGQNNETRFRLNGRDGGGGGVSLSGFQNKAITIGANNAGAEKTAADFAEVLVYDRALDANEQAAVGFHLGTKYKIDGEWNPAPAEIMALASRVRS